jgi:hypothetical protein
VRALAAVLLLAVVGCASPTAPSDRAQLEQARARWAAQGGDSYSFELQRDCFCLLAGRRISITVENGAVTTAEDANSKDTIAQTFLVYLLTVPDLFDLISSALDSGVAALSVSYDRLYGYPTHIAIDYSATVADDELALTASNLVLHPALGATR